MYQKEKSPTLNAGDLNTMVKHPKRSYMRRIGISQILAALYYLLLILKELGLF
jgi:hypothetical protein